MKEPKNILVVDNFFKDEKKTQELKGLFPQYQIFDYHNDKIEVNNFLVSEFFDLVIIFDFIFKVKFYNPLIICNSEVKFFREYLSPKSFEKSINFYKGVEIRNGL